MSKIKATKMISIIIPIYNAEKTLHSCIESVISQNSNEYEIILINDGSTDNSQKICEEYDEKFQNIRLFNTENKGAYAARLLGVNRANGKYITFLDSDDTFKENVLRNVVEELKFNVDVLVTSCKKSFIINQAEYQKDLISYKINAALHGRFFRKDILCNSLLEIPRYFVVGEDLIFNLRVSLYAKKIKYSQLIIYNYNLNYASITHNFKRSWEYEKKFHLLIKKTFICQLPQMDEELEIYYYRSFLNGCKFALLNNSKIDYSDCEWKNMKGVLNQHREILYWDEKLIIDIPYSSFCRNLIRVLYKLI